MRWLEVLGIVPKNQRDAISLRSDSYWHVESCRDPALFYRALVHITVPAAVVHLEGTTEPRVPAFLRKRLSPDPTPVALGTIWPVSDTFDMDATTENLTMLAELIDRHRISMPAIHTHLYVGREMLLQWYDAFGDDPISVSTRVPESKVQSFAAALRRPFRREGPSA